MRRVFSSHNQLLVHHARNLLETAGIRAELRNLAVSSAMGELPPAECQAEIWVEERELRQALDVLSRPQPPGESWRCAACGESSEPQFAQCWRCGADRPA